MNLVFDSCNKLKQLVFETIVFSALASVLDLLSGLFFRKGCRSPAVTSTSISVSLFLPNILLRFLGRRNNADWRFIPAMFSVGNSLLWHTYILFEKVVWVFFYQYTSLVALSTCSLSNRTIPWMSAHIHHHILRRHKYEIQPRPNSALTCIKKFGHQIYQTLESRPG